MRPDSVDAVIGTLRPAPDGRGHLAQIWSEMFQRTVELTVGSNPPNPQELQGIDDLLHWSPQVVEALKTGSHAYFTDSVDSTDVGSEGEFDHVQGPEQVLGLVDPVGIEFETHPDRPGEVFSHWELDCDWDVEHGMEWIIRGRDEVVLVDAYNGTSIGYALSEHLGYPTQA